MNNFFGQVKDELRKVIWPSRKEATMTTIVVMILTAVFTFGLFLVDNLLTYINTLIF